MPRIKEFDIDPVDVDADGIAQSQTPASGGEQSLTLNGALTSGGTYTAADGDSSPGRQISITSAADDSGRTFTVTGTDADGQAQTESITGPNATAVESSQYWQTVTEITVDADTAGAITVGTVDELASKTIMLNRHADDGAHVQYDVTGTISVTSQVTFDRIRDEGVYTNQESLSWVDASIGNTGDSFEQLPKGAYALRLLVASHSSDAEFQAFVSEER